MHDTLHFTDLRKKADIVIFKKRDYTVKAILQDRAKSMTPLVSTEQSSVCQENFMSDFEQHFSNPLRKQVKQNHHDFLKEARKSVQPQSQEFKISDQTDYLLSHDHRKRTQQHYKILVKNAIKLPNVKDKRMLKTENLIKRSHAREDLRRSKEME